MEDGLERLTVSLKASMAAWAAFSSVNSTMPHPFDLPLDSCTPQISLVSGVNI